ncbi:hypothetical protein ACBJ59_57160 [Nonomuraea sp. MTCD27]|uniref:hypothetical protein n=1 Tax=Nonomuraea sp. MTCD27 TaxID=1676747 RepID=UPI0035C032A5
MTRSTLMEAQRRYQRRRSRELRAGTWRGLVNADNARAHVRNMNRIWLVSYGALAEAVGLNKSTVFHVMDGSPSRGLEPPAKISARVSDAILAFVVDDLPDHVRINAIGSARRLRALAVMGWPLKEIASRTEVDETHLQAIRARVRATTSVSIARRIRNAAEELAALDPKEHLPKASVGYTRSHAVTQRWLPLHAWADAIDEPDAKPWQTVRCSYPTCVNGSKDERLLCDTHLKLLKKRGTLDGARLMRNTQALLEDARFILATDPPINPHTQEIDGERLAERLGTTWEALERLLNRAELSLGKLREPA